LNQVAQQVRQAGFVEDATSQFVFDQLFGSELQNKDDWQGAPRARQIDGGVQHLAGYIDSALDRVFVAIGQEELGNPRESPARLCGQPNEAWTQVWPIIIEVSVENR
jgi:hypothetical protein